VIRTFRKLGVLVVIVGAASSPFAQEIASLSAMPQSPGIGEPVRFKISLKSTNGVYACGLQVNLGDGQTKEFRVYDERAAQIEFEHVYSRSGAYPIVADGKGFLRGLKSVAACDGNRSLALTVGQQQAPSCVPPSDEYRTVNCPPGTVGKILQKRSYACPGPTMSGWKTESTDCKSASSTREAPPSVAVPRPSPQPPAPQPTPSMPRPAPKPQVGE
jgi:hypothetical protein